MCGEGGILEFSLLDFDLNSEMQSHFSIGFWFSNSKSHGHGFGFLNSDFWILYNFDLKYLQFRGCRDYTGS